MLVASAISIMVIGGTYMVYDASQSTARADERKVDLQQNARSALDLLLWQIRLAGYLNLGRTPNRIAIGTDTMLVVRGDVQLTGTAAIADTLFAVHRNTTAACPAPPCLVTGTNVYTVNAAQAVLAFKVDSVTFTYFDQSNLALVTPLDGVTAGGYPNGAAAASPLPGNTADRDAVRKIRVTLTAVDQTVSAGPGVGSRPDQLTLSADMRFRNAD
jgi:Tfp pilus assembly protein PilW